MNYRVKVKLTGPGAVPGSVWFRDHVRIHKTKKLPYSSIFVAEPVGRWMRWAKLYLPDAFVAMRTEVR